MINILKGKLVVISTKTKNDKGLRVTFPTKKGGTSIPTSIPSGQLHPELAAKPVTELDNLDVELELYCGQLRRVRPVGVQWIDTVKTKNPFPQAANTEDSQKGDFHNPYNFIPAPPRRVDHPELGDSAPVSHGVYHVNRWSGKIAVKLTTITPLLIPDAARAYFQDEETKKNGHKSYPIRVDKNNQPYVPPTSIKGMLRSAYEAVTNSRFSVFEKHSERLAYRMPTSLGLQMVPAQIEIGEAGNNLICLFPGTSTIGPDGTPQPNLMYAAWLPRYYRGKISSNACRYPNGSLPQHQDEVEAWVEKFQHWRWDKRQDKHIPDFQYWRVRLIVPINEELGTKPQKTANTNKQTGRSHHESLGEFEKIRGFTCITNPNIDKKHDERIFFNTDDRLISKPLTEDLEKQWENLISDYQKIHEDEICSKHKSSPPALNHSVWSRHIQGVGFTLATQERNLSSKTLCYARVKPSASGYEILGLYPVIIARELFNKSPQELLSQELQPATNINHLSPSERVFGWVRQEKKQGESSQGSYKGNLRISNVRCITPKANEEFAEPGLPLAILGEPKPQQTRFYTAEDKHGTPLASKVSKEKGYQDLNKGLRGRKVYPHQRALPNGHWNEPMTPNHPPVEGHYKEYRRPQLNGNEQRDDQNRSIKAWVKPGSQFTFLIDITNLSSVELGALLWLLDLPPEHFHRLGGGKPLGFGSVRLEIDWSQTELKMGQQWRQFYRSLLTNEQIQSVEVQKCKQVFQQEIAKAYGDEFAKIPFIAAFVLCARGFDDKLPIHYPRIQSELNSEGKVFDWFVKNESSSGQKISLSPLVNDPGLPLMPTHL